MCILFIYTNPSPSKGRYRLILAANRDEYLVRPAGPAHRWPGHEDVIGGVDLEPGREGGTWLGMSLKRTSGLRVGVLLNVTGEEHIPGALGRGFIVTDYLKGEDDTKRYIDKITAGNKTYNAFSFVSVELTETEEKTYYYSNMRVPDRITEYDSGDVLGFGNSLPDCPYVKVQKGRAKFLEIVEQHGNDEVDGLIQDLLGFLKWEEKHMPDAELTRRAADKAEFQSSVFVNGPDVGYGTRTHTIILADWDGNVHFVEDTMECPIDIHQPRWHTQHIKSHF